MNKSVHRWAILLGGIILFSPLFAHADVVAYMAVGNKTLLLESAPQLGPKTYMLEFTGVDSPWAGKVIRVEKTHTINGDRYAFEHDVKLSSGTIKRNFNILVDGDQTLVAGTLVPTVDLYTSGGAREGLKFVQDPELTRSSQGAGLAAQYQKAPYQPAVE